MFNINRRTFLGITGASAAINPPPRLFNEGETELPTGGYGAGGYGDGGYGGAEPGPPPLPGYDNPPQDLTGDGRYEDVTGTGTVTFPDAIALARHITSPEVSDNPEYYQFVVDDRVSFADAVEVARIAEDWDDDDDDDDEND